MSAVSSLSICAGWLGAVGSFCRRVEESTKLNEWRRATPPARLGRFLQHERRLRDRALHILGQVSLESRRGARGRNSERHGSACRTLRGGAGGGRGRTSKKPIRPARSASGILDPPCKSTRTLRKREDIGSVGPTSFTRRASPNFARDQLVRGSPHFWLVHTKPQVSLLLEGRGRRAQSRPQRRCTHPVASVTMSSQSFRDA